MYISIPNVKLTQVNLGAKGAIFIGMERYGNHRPSRYVVIDGGKEVNGKFALGLSGKGAFQALRLERGEPLVGIELPEPHLVMLEIQDPITIPYNGSLNVGQLLVTSAAAYIGIEWHHSVTNFALVDLETWTMHSYADLDTSGGYALLGKWRIVHRLKDQTTLLAEAPPLSAV